MGIGKLIHAFKENQYLTVILKESYHGGIKSGKLLVWLITSGVMGAATVKDISSSITRLVFRYAFSV